MPAAHPAWWRPAGEALSYRDPVMARLVAAYKGGVMRSRGDALSTLLRAIVGQQISVKAADAVWGRFMQACGGAEVTLRADSILRLSDEVLRGCGLSGQKVKYVRGVCNGFACGTVHPGLWDGMADEAVIAELVKLPGIGRWTAEMFLMFFLLRPDVLPVDDLGLVKAFRLQYGGRWKTGGPVKVWQGRLRRAAEAWKPYRSAAVWYLWRSLDPVEVSY